MDEWGERDLAYKIGVDGSAFVGRLFDEPLVMPQRGVYEAADCGRSGSAGASPMCMRTCEHVCVRLCVLRITAIV